MTPTPTPTQAPATAPAGRVVTVRIPGGRTGFRARPALVYLPPALRAHPHLRLPVVELLHGTEGGPADWLQRGHAAATLDAFAAAHDGQAPIVVMPDINGNVSVDSECIRGAGGGDVETYLLDTVPAYVLAHFPATPDRRRWAIAGASEGGTCAMVLALRAYPRYRLFGAFSALARLTVGDTDDRVSTVRILFGGSYSDYDAHDPTVLLPAHRYPRLAAWFEAGRGDSGVLRDQVRLASWARAAGVDTRSTTAPGGHSWAVWTQAWRQLLPWLWARTA